jgi:hypothetical protein
MQYGISWFWLEPFVILLLYLKRSKLVTGYWLARRSYETHEVAKAGYWLLVTPIFFNF